MNEKTAVIKCLLDAIFFAAFNPFPFFPEPMKSTLLSLTLDMPIEANSKNQNRVTNSVDPDETAHL